MKLMRKKSFYAWIHQFWYDTVLRFIQLMCSKVSHTFWYSVFYGVLGTLRMLVISFSYLFKHFKLKSAENLCDIDCLVHVLRNNIYVSFGKSTFASQNLRIRFNLFAEIKDIEKNIISNLHGCNISFRVIKIIKTRVFKSIKEWWMFAFS